MRLAPAVAAAVVLALAACSDTTRTIETATSNPDAYAVYRPASLSTPPDFARRPNKDDAQTRAVPTRQAARFARNSGPEIPADWTGMSRGTMAFLLENRANEADSKIRDTLNRDTSVYSNEKPEMTEKLLFGNVPKAAAAGTDNAIVISRDKPSGLFSKLF